MVGGEILAVADSPREGWLSMDGYAADFAAHLDAFPLPVRLVRLPGHPSRWPAVGRVSVSIDRYLRLPLVIKRSKCRAVHVLDHSYAHLVASSAPRPTVVTCHDLTPLKVASGGIGMGLYRRAVLRLREASMLLADSEATARDLAALARVEPSRVRVVPMPVRAVFFGLDRGGVVPYSILHAGSNADYKRVGLAVDAVILLRARGLPVSFWKVGAHLPKELAEKLTIAGVTVRDYGRVSSAQVEAIYREAAVLVFPSRNEGFGWPVAEAMAARLPVVASDITVLREVSGGLVHLVSSDQPEPYADALEAVLGSAPEDGDDAFAWAQRSRWSEHVKALADAYRAVL
jgi:glycosyltransferase involved in cell wall biosynthesis